jgi:hypothetical protein
MHRTRRKARHRQCSGSRIAERLPMKKPPASADCAPLSTMRPLRTIGPPAPHAGGELQQPGEDRPCAEHREHVAHVADHHRMTAAVKAD